MLYDRRDFGLLRLAGTYQWLPAAPLKKLSALKTLRREAELLSTLGLVSYVMQVIFSSINEAHCDVMIDPYINSLRADRSGPDNTGG